MVQTFPDPCQILLLKKKATMKSKKYKMPNLQETDRAPSTLSNGKGTLSPKIPGYHEANLNTCKNYSKNSNKDKHEHTQDNPLKRGYEHLPSKSSRTVDKVQLSEHPD